MRYGLTDYEWAAVRPLLPNKPRGVARVDDRPILNGIFWVLRSCQNLLADEKRKTKISAVHALAVGTLMSGTNGLSKDAAQLLQLLPGQIRPSGVITE